MPTASEASPFKSPFARVNTPTKSPRTPTPGASRPRRDWDMYMTDGDQYKLSKEAQLKKKQQMVSKNNILASPVDGARTPGSFMTPRKPTPAREHRQQPQHLSFRTEESDAETDVEPNSLDLVEATPDKTPLRDVTNTASPFVRKPTATKLKKKKQNKTESPATDTTSGKMNVVEQRELDDVNAMLQSLSSELTLFEQLSGAKSALDNDDLKTSLAIEHKSLPSAMKSTLKLLCQVISYLLKSEVTRQAAEERHADLQQQIDALKQALHTANKVQEPTPTSSASTSSATTKPFASPARIAGSDAQLTPFRVSDGFTSREEMSTPSVASPVARELSARTLASAGMVDEATAVTSLATPTFDASANMDVTTPALYSRPLRKTATSDWLFDTAFLQTEAAPTLSQLAPTAPSDDWKTPDYTTQVQEMTTKAVLQRLTQQAEPHTPPRRAVPTPTVIPATSAPPDTNIMRHLMQQTEPATPPRQAPASAPISSSARPTVYIKQPSPSAVQFEQLEDNTFSALPEHLLPLPAKQPVHPFQLGANSSSVGATQQPSSMEQRVTGRRLDRAAGADLEQANLPEPWKSWVLAK